MRVILCVPITLLCLTTFGCDAGDPAVDVPSIVFGAPASIDMGEFAPRGVVAADVDSDGDIDLVTRNGDWQGISVLLNDGAGNFPQSLHMDGSSIFIWRIVPADLDHDGDLDLILPTASSDASFHVALNDGKGVFSVTTFYLGEFGRTMSMNAVANDFDGDGRIDILVKPERDRDVVLMSGDADMLFRERTVALPADYAPWVVASSDFDRNGTPDLIVASDAQVHRLSNQGDGRFEEAAVYTVDQYPRNVLMGDYDRDGVDDLIVSSVKGVRALTGLGPTGEMRWSRLSMLPSYYALNGIFDGRQSAQPAVFSAPEGDTGRITIYRHTKNGEFENAAQIDIERMGGWGWFDNFAVGDFNGDGFDDIVHPITLDNKLLMYMNATNRVH